MELMLHGSLADVIHNETITLDGEMIGQMLQDVVNGYVYAMNRNVFVLVYVFIRAMRACLRKESSRSDMCRCAHLECTYACY